jgi:hypothetical protein
VHVAVRLQQRNISPVLDRVDLIGAFLRKNNRHVRWYALSGESGQREPVRAWQYCLGKNEIKTLPQIDQRDRFQRRTTLLEYDPVRSSQFANRLLPTGPSLIL